MQLQGAGKTDGAVMMAIAPRLLVKVGVCVVSLNLHRRHLDESQRAIVAGKISTLKDGQRSDHVEGLPIGRAAEMLNVGERSVARAREVIEHGTPELVTAVEQGRVSVSACSKSELKHGEFQNWVVINCEFSYPSAAVYLRAAKQNSRGLEFSSLSKLLNGDSDEPAEPQHQREPEPLSADGLTKDDLPNDSTSAHTLLSKKPNSTEYCSTLPHLAERQKHCYPHSYPLAVGAA